MWISSQRRFLGAALLGTVALPGYALTTYALAAPQPTLISSVVLPPSWSAQADGFASVEALGQKGTTGGQGGHVVTVDNLVDLETYAAAPEPYVILIKGTIAKEPFGGNINVSSNKTLLGLGNDATILHGELHLVGVQNVIIRNLTIKDSWVPNDPGGKKFDHDAIQMDNCHHIWIDHCRLTHMEDGLIDLRKKSDYVTVSWCVLSNHDKVFGIGWTTDNDALHVTIHHNWIHDTVQRNPSFGDGTGHLYDNLLQNIASYGNYSRGKSKLVVENSVFENVNNPLICDAGSELVVRGNILKNCTTTDQEKTAKQGKGEAFDPRAYYSYTLDDATKVAALVQAGAGPQAGVEPPSEVKAAGTAKTITVAADGTGDFKTLQEAVEAIPDNAAARTIVRIKPGRYQRQLILPATKTNVSFEGEDAEKTVLTFAINTNEEQPAGINPRYKGTGVVVLGDGFQAKNLTFENASGDHGQALALRIDGDRAFIKDCRLLGWQDTLMLNNGRQYFKDCLIEGRVDFIYGSGTSVFDTCEIRSKNGGHITAASTPQEKPYGFVFLNCKLTSSPTPWIDPATGQPPAGREVGAQADLGRPWRPYASVTYINCTMGDHIKAEGWNNWGKAENEKTARYAEFGSKTPEGKPVDVSKRMAWAKVLTPEEAAHYTTENVFGDWTPTP